MEWVPYLIGGVAFILILLAVAVYIRTQKKRKSTDSEQSSGSSPVSERDQENTEFVPTAQDVQTLAKYGYTVIPGNPSKCTRTGPDGTVYICGTSWQLGGIRELLRG